MSKDLTVTTPLEKVLSMWQDEKQLKTIRDMYAKNATEDEFKTFVQMGIATGLNPFLREIWCVKYDKNAAAQIFVARDGYRKIISRNPNYDYHFVDAVYSNDDYCFDLTKGEVRHTSNFKDRGKLMGAYCLVKMKNSSRPHYVFVDVTEYNTNQSIWKSKPATMIKKVAEAQTIRMADSTCSGTYSDDETPENMHKESKSMDLNKRFGLVQDKETIDGEVVKQAVTSMKEDVEKKASELNINLETGEIISPPLHPSRENAPTFDEIKEKMEKAKTVEILTEAASVVSELKLEPEQHKELTTVYREKLKALKAVAGA